MGSKGALSQDWPTNSDGDAAPELLEACKALLDAFEGYEMLAALDLTIQEQARSVIARAEGNNDTL